jgi:hypothetical protein
MTKVCPVTAAMIEAGAEIFKARQDRHNSAEYTVWLIYTAMEAARIPDPEATKLREALEPFAAVADDPCFAGHEDSYAPRPSRGRPCLGDYRRARDVLAALNPSPALVGDEDAAR